MPYRRYDLLQPIISLIDRAKFQVYPLFVGAKNIRIIKAAYKAQIYCTADILTEYGHSVESTLFRTEKLARLLSSSDPSVILGAYKCAYDLLIDFVSLKRGNIQYGDFKGLLGTTDEVADALVAPVNKLVSAVFCCLPAYKVNDIWVGHNTHAVSLLAQYFGLLTKVCLDNPSLEDTALSQYLTLEMNYPDQLQDSALVAKLRTILTRHLKEFKYAGDRCKHGNGAVADMGVKSKLEKYKSLKTDALLDYVFKREGLAGLSSYSPLPLQGRRLERCSRLQFVPKNVSKLRSISMEPTALQYVQQGVMSALYAYIKTHKVLGKHIKLSDQTQNRCLAYDGSVSNNYATIDLSSASDLVGYELVKELFSGLPEVWRWLVSTRSTHTELPTKERILLKKFAPMGSAICFPLETLIFAACAELAIEQTRHVGQRIVPSKNNTTSFFSVYGDDIIVPIYAYDRCVEILCSLGFQINTQKSYCDSPFKESCGGNYLCGVDITPFRWKGDLFDRGGRLSPEGYESICGYANQAYSHSLKLTRCFTLEMLRLNKKQPLFRDTIDRAPAIFSTHNTNFSCKRKTAYRASGILPEAIKLIANGINPPFFRSDYQGEYLVVSGTATELTSEVDAADSELQSVLLYEALLAHSRVKPRYKRTIRYRKGHREVSLSDNGSRPNINGVITTKTRPGVLLSPGVPRTVLCFDVDSPISVKGFVRTRLRFRQSYVPTWID